MQETLKRCTKCGEEKPASSKHFAKQSAGKYGLAAWCKPCRQAYWRDYCSKNPAAKADYYAANRDVIIAKAKTRRKERGLERDERNLENARKAAARWRKKNPGARAEYYRLYDALNKEQKRQKRQEREQRPDQKEKSRQYSRRWRKENPETARAHVRNRHARKRANGGTHSAKDIARLRKHQKDRCWWCGKKLTDKYHVDHRIPLARGGSNGPENLVIACAKCNQRKGPKMPWQIENPRLL